MSAPGRLTKDELVTVQRGIQLAKPAGASFRRVQKDLPGAAIAPPAGGYRPEAMQTAMHIAGGVHGTRAARIAWGLNPRSVVAIAAHPNGTHEDGMCVDLVGVAYGKRMERILNSHGWFRTFGPKDPNHWRYDPSKDQHRPKKKPAAKK